MLLTGFWLLHWREGRNGRRWQQSSSATYDCAVCDMWVFFWLSNYVQSNYTGVYLPGALLLPPWDLVCCAQRAILCTGNEGRSCGSPAVCGGLCCELEGFYIWTIKAIAAFYVVGLPSKRVWARNLIKNNREKTIIFSVCHHSLSLTCLAAGHAVGWNEWEKRECFSVLFQKPKPYCPVYFG